MYDWRRNYRFELERAQAAREIGNEGMARVCARRAAGIVAGEYLQQINQRRPSHSAYENLNSLLSLPNLPPDIPKVVEHFVQKVDESHNLPVEADLIEETRWLASQLFPGEE